jgi:uracil-DNA glycosylase family 4
MKNDFTSFRQTRCDSWDDLREWTKCSRCSLRKPNEKVVLGAGNRNADIMIVSEYPGSAEARKGIPFVGTAGDHLKNLVQMLFKVDLYEMFYVTNVVACRPGQSKVKASTLKICIDRLLCEIYLVDPILIIAAGTLAVTTLTGKSYPSEAMSGLIERVEFPGKIHPYTLPVMVWPNPVQFWRHHDTADDGVIHQAFYALEKAVNLVAKTKKLVYDEDVAIAPLKFDEPETWRIYDKSSEPDDTKSE